MGSGHHRPVSWSLTLLPNPLDHWGPEGVTPGLSGWGRRSPGATSASPTSPPHLPHVLKTRTSGGFGEEGSRLGCVLSLRPMFPVLSLRSPSFGLRR